jgi:hypothetical protein
MKPLTRRSVTTGLAAAVTAIPVVGLCDVAENASKLPALIKAHRAAHRAFCKAITREDEMKLAYEKAHPEPIIVPCLLGGGMSLSNGYEACQEHFACGYKNQLENNLK